MQYVCIPLLLLEGDEVSLFVLAAGVLAACSGTGDGAALSSASEVSDGDAGGFSFFSFKIGNGDALRRLSLDCERGAFIREELQPINCKNSSHK